MQTRGVDPVVFLVCSSMSSRWQHVKRGMSTITDFQSLRLVKITGARKARPLGSGHFRVTQHKSSPLHNIKNNNNFSGLNLRNPVTLIEMPVALLLKIMETAEMSYLSEKDRNRCTFCICMTSHGRKVSRIHKQQGASSLVPPKINTCIKD